MHTIERHLAILAGMLFAVLNANSGPVPVPDAKKITVSDLMVSNILSNRFGMLDYFKKLKLDQQCKTPILNINEFKTLESDNNIAPCLCTVIYNMTLELNTILKNVSETAEPNFSIDESSNLAVYEVWKNVSIQSSSLKLFMEPLNDEDKWEVVCHSIKDKTLTRYCKFLNFEVMLWHNFLPKLNEPKKKNIDNVLKNIVPPIPNSVIPVEPTIIGGNKMYAETDDSLKFNNMNNIEEEPAEGNNNKEDETTIEDIEDKPIDLLDTPLTKSTKLKDDSKSNNDYPNPEDGTLIDSEAKKAQSSFSQKNTFTNHEFGDVEDSHFLFYFGVMTAFSLLFYLALYNKKKIIALLIEGRRSTNHRRRPNTASYSKVETDDGTTVF